MIPEAAVQAAAQSFRGYTPEDSADYLEREINAACRAEAKRLLGAATPHIGLALMEELRLVGQYEAADLVGQLTDAP